MRKGVLRDLVNWAVRFYDLRAGAVRCVELELLSGGWRAWVSLRAHRDGRRRLITRPRRIFLVGRDDTAGGILIGQIHAQLQ